MFTESDEEFHPPGREPHWQESFYFNWSNPATDDFGLVRIGVNPGAGTADAVAMLFHRGRLAHVHAAVGEPFSNDGRSRPVTAGIRVGHLELRMVRPMSTWLIRLDAPRAHAELRWSAFTPVIDFAGCFPGDASHTQEHLEQSGRVIGSVTIDGATRKIDGLGQRDKSWGSRDWSAIRGWEWIAAQFDDGSALNATLTHVEGLSQSAGFFFHDGITDLVTETSIDYCWAAEHQPAQAVITVKLQSGRHERFSAEVSGRAPLAKKGLFIEESPAHFVHHGDTAPVIGHGVVEHAHQVGTLGTVRRLHRLAPVLAHAVRNR